MVLEDVVVLFNLILTSLETDNDTLRHPIRKRSHPTRHHCHLTDYSFRCLSNDHILSEFIAMPEQETGLICFGKVSYANVANIEDHTTVLICDKRISWSICSHVVAALIVLKGIQYFS
jgi:hypothetical protein